MSVFVITSRKNSESSTVHFEVFVTGDMMDLKFTLMGVGVRCHIIIPEQLLAASAEFCSPS